MIQLQQVHKSYQMGKNDYHALRGVDLQIDAGECVAIVGPSGSGKSTMMHIIGLLDRASSGTYYLDHQSVADLNDDDLAMWRGRHLGFVFQSFFLLSAYSALDNVALPLQYQQVGRREAYRRSSSVLERMGLLDLQAHLPTELSGGQKQRVAIARALVTNPKILLADEPTGALDTETGAHILRCLQQINRDDGVTVVVVTHDPVVAASCDRQIKIQDGLVVV